MDSIVTWFTINLAPHISKEAAVFIISMMPILELRGGLLASSLLKLPLLKAIPICIIGNILPIPFILLFITKIFHWMKRFRPFRPMVEWFERKALSKSDKIARWEFWGLVLFVGIPIPGTGAWMGSLAAALLDIDFKKAILAELLGVCIATIIMSFVSYGLLGQLF